MLPWQLLLAALLGAPQASGLRTGRNGWFDGFRPLVRSNPAAGQLLVREDACVQGGGKYPQEAAFGTTERSTLEGAMQVLPSSSSPAGHRSTDGALLLLTVHHMHSFSVYNIAHLAVSAFPVFDALRFAEQNGRPVDIGAVLFWQIERKSGFLSLYDWFTHVPRLLGSRGNETSLLFAEDLALGVCAREVILYNRPIVEGKVETHFFTSPARARAFRETALVSLGYGPAAMLPPRGRTALLAVRQPPQGYKNIEEVTEKTRRWLEQRCWKLKVWTVGEGDMSFRNQVELFSDADLSISTYGAQLSNIAWQPPGSGVLIVHKCNMMRRLFAREAHEAGLQVFKSFPSNCALSSYGHTGQDTLDFGEHTVDFERDLAPTLQRALDALGRPDCEGHMRARPAKKD